MRRIKRLLGWILGLAAVCLPVALLWAATTITTQQIRDDAVTGAKIDENTVGETNIVVGTLDNRYYTETEINGLIYTETELLTGSLDGRYYTETEVDALVGGAGIIYQADESSLILTDTTFSIKPGGVTATELSEAYYTETEVVALFAAILHSHGDLYYTETEIVALFAPIVHSHDDRYYTETEIIAGYSALGHNHTLGEITDVDTYAGHAGEYAKVKAGEDGIEYGTPAGGGTAYQADESSLTLTDTTFSLKDGGVTAAKLSDAIYTETEINALLADKVDSDSSVYIDLVTNAAGYAIAQGVTGKVAIFGGTTIISDSTFTDTQMRTKHLRFTILDPNTLVDTTICLIPKLDAAITVDSIIVTCDADPATEITGDLKYADTFIGLASPTVINDFDTAAGIREDNSMESAAVSAGKCVYIDFDVTPEAAILQISFDIVYHY